MKKSIAIMIVLIALVAIVSIAASPALAQCAMCKESVANSEEGTSLASRLNLAVVILLLPAVAMFVGLFGVFYRYRNPQDEPTERQK
ncbi:MAG: hypothetical protein AB1631_31705 [Acidobacteriota bacterium]